MDLQQIKILKSIKDNGSLNAASEELYMAKSAISHSIKQLEREFGFTLLDRDGYRVQLSPKAEMFLSKAERILKYQEELDAFRKQLGENIESQIKLSATMLLPLKTISKLIKDTNREFKNTSILLEREVLSGERMLLEDQVDIAITEVNNQDINLEYKKILTVQMPLVISNKHPFLNLKQKNLETLSKYPQIVLRSTIQDTSNLGGLYEDSLKWRVSDDNTKKELIKEGLGWGRLPLYMIEKEIESGSLSILDKIEKIRDIDIYIVRKANHYQGKVAEFIWQQFF